MFPFFEQLDCGTKSEYLFVPWYSRRYGGWIVEIDIKHENIWNYETAQNYDALNTGMFSPEAVSPAVARLEKLSGGGRTLEFAIGTGRIAIPLAQRGTSVTGIELSKPMIEQLMQRKYATKIYENARFS